MTPEQLAGVGLGLWLDFQRRFEAWQYETKAVWSPSSASRAEDIPSTYLAYVSEVSEKSYEQIVTGFGGGGHESLSSSAPGVQNAMQWFLVPRAGANSGESAVQYLAYPNSYLNITPILNNGYWADKGVQ
ncbi:MAG: hypothetical protein HZB19_09775 [Chloroflexi bacterium]|nr:hypothetical protein [Chloroflexota bacterium]